MNKNNGINKAKWISWTSLLAVLSAITFFILDIFMPEHDHIILAIGVLLIFSIITLVAHRIYLIHQLIKTVKLNA